METKTELTSPTPYHALSNLIENPAEDNILTANHPEEKKLLDLEQLLDTLKEQIQCPITLAIFKEPVKLIPEQARDYHLGTSVVEKEAYDELVRHGRRRDPLSQIAIRGYLRDREKEALVETYLKFRPQDRKDQYQCNDLHADLPPPIMNGATINTHRNALRPPSNRRRIEAGNLWLINNEPFMTNPNLILLYTCGMCFIPAFTMFTGACIAGYPTRVYKPRFTDLSMNGLLFCTTNALLAIPVFLRGTTTMNNLCRIDCIIIVTAAFTILANSIPINWRDDVSESPEIVSKRAIASTIGVTLYGSVVGLGLFAHNRRLRNDYITRTDIPQDVPAAPALQV